VIPYGICESPVAVKHKLLLTAIHCLLTYLRTYPINGPLKRLIKNTKEYTIEQTFEALSAHLALLARFAAVFKQRMFLEVISLLESDRADGTDERALVGMSPPMILVRRVLRELLAADVARPVAVACRRRGGRRRRRREQRMGPPGPEERPGGRQRRDVAEEAGAVQSDCRSLWTRLEQGADSRVNVDGGGVQLARVQSVVHLEVLQRDETFAAFATDEQLRLMYRRRNSARTRPAFGRGRARRG